MSVDPLEGIDADGYITTGADPARIPAGYEDVLAETRTVGLSEQIAELLRGAQRP